MPTSGPAQMPETPAPVTPALDDAAKHGTEKAGPEPWEEHAFMLSLFKQEKFITRADAKTYLMSLYLGQTLG